MRHLTPRLLATGLLALVAFSPLRGADIEHRFVATDESGHQLIYVDEANPGNDWTIPLGGNRDMQVSKDGKILVSVPSGYREYDLTTGKMLKDVTIGEGIQSIVRLDNGHTFLASKRDIIELDGDDKVLATHTVNMGDFFRLLRINHDGNFLHTAGPTTVREIRPNGEIVREIDLAKITPESSKPYFAEQLADGNYLISTGFGATVLLVDQDWALIKSYGGKGKVEGVETHFFADAQQLKNGHIVVAHWSGHGRTDSQKAPQAIEFDQDGKVVWTWHDAARAGSLHGIQILE